ncbi:transposase, partial [candidate division WOR-3 bacterium]|nr:transposase [candidate division WOR-3 bacterium]
MARALRIQFPGAFYHVTCRGIERRQIFMDDADRNKFLELLSGSLETYQVVVFAYTLMANHFHLLIQTRKANCSEFMRHFNICYTGWFNYRH